MKWVDVCRMFSKIYVCKIFKENIDCQIISDKWDGKLGGQVPSVVKARDGLNPDDERKL